MARPANPALREQVLAAALRIVEQCGPDCVTMREVAEEVGYSPTTLYLYFKDKGEILREIVVRGFEDLAGFLATSAVGPTAVDRLRQRTRAYIMWGLTNPGRYLLMFERGGDEVQWEPADVARVERSVVDGTRDVAEAMEAGALPGVGDAMSYAMLMWAGTHGVTSLAIARRLVPGMPEMSAERAVAAATSMGDEMVSRLLAPPSV